MLPRGRVGRQWVIPGRAVYLSGVDTIRFRLGGRRSLADADVLAELTGRIERIAPDTRRRWGRMTPHQMLVHLAETHEAVLGRASFDMPVRSSNRVIKAFVLQLPVRWVRNLNFGVSEAPAPSQAKPNRIHPGKVDDPTRYHPLTTPPSPG